MVRILETPEEVRDKDYLADYRPQVSRPDWQRSLPDDLRLNRVSLPGTHDTCSFYGGDMRRTQSWPVDLQLQAGIRLLDMRPRYAFDRLPIHHEDNFQETFLDVELQRVSDFLAAHPSEFVVMNYRREYTIEGNTRNEGFPARVHQAVQKAMGKDKDGKSRFLYLHRPMTPPTVGEVRNKLIVISIEDQSHDHGPSVNIQLEKLQNDYNVDLATGQAGKKGAAEAIFNAWPPTTNGYFMNFMSASSGGGYPNAQADWMNHWLLQKLNEVGSDGKKTLRGVGLLLMDFPSEKLIGGIIERNFL